MSYVQRVLQPGETVVHQSRLHPLIFLPPLLLLVIAVALFVVSMQFTGDVKIGLEAAAAIFGAFTIASWARAAIRRATTELAVTDRRVIYKAGLLAPHTPPAPAALPRSRSRGGGRPAEHAAALSIGLSAVILAASVHEPRVLTIRLGGGRGDGEAVEALPSGPLEAEHRTLEIGLRTWVERQTSQRLGYVEQLYTFGDRDRLVGARRGRDPRA